MYTFEREEYFAAQDTINIIRCTDSYSSPAHTHEFAELIFISAGSCRQIIDGVAYDAEPGDLFFVNYGQSHAFESKTKDLQYYNLLYLPWFFSEELINSENIYEIFRISLFREFAEYESEQTQQVRFRGGEYLDVKKLVEDMYRELREKQVGYRSVLNGYSRVLFSKILRRLQQGRLPEDQTSVQRITAECLAYIDAHCFEKITPREIAEHTFYHPAYLSRIFKASCGRSLSEYIKEKRVREAARLLTAGALPLERVMEQVGYTDKKQFYKNFRELYGQTPTEYRKSHPGKNPPPEG